MYSVRQSHKTFESGGKQIGLDCFLPDGNGLRFPAVVGLHGSGGGHAYMAEPASMLAQHGFAVYVLHYFDRTGTTWAKDRGEILRNSPIWMKTVWDSVSFVTREPGRWIRSASDLWDFLSERDSKNHTGSHTHKRDTLLYQVYSIEYYNTRKK